jgi:hypothetical protein
MRSLAAELEKALVSLAAATARGGGSGSGGGGGGAGGGAGGGESPLTGAAGSSVGSDGSGPSTPSTSAAGGGPPGVATLLRSALEDLARQTDAARMLQARCGDLEDRAAYLDSELRRASGDVQKLRAALKDERRKNEKLFATLDLEREANLQAQATISDLQARGGGGGGGGGGALGGGGVGGGGGGGGGIGAARDPSSSFGPRSEAGRGASMSRMSFAAALATPNKGAGFGER